MAKIGDYKISDIYQGGYSSLAPGYSQIATGSFGLTTDPRTANILKEFSTKLSTGVKQIELEFISPEMIDSIPKQQIEEVRRLSNLTGVGVSVHGPVIDSAGITQQGFSELNRESSERRIINTIERSHELNPKGNISVNFHSAEGIPGTEWKKIPDEKKGAEGEARRLIVVNRESGKLAPLEEEKMFYPDMREYNPEIEKRLESGQLTQSELRKQLSEGKIKKTDLFRTIPLEKGEIKTPESRLQNLNHTEWGNSISQLIFNKERADEILQKNAPIIQDLFNEKRELKVDPQVIQHDPIARRAISHYKNAETYLDDTRQHINGLFHKAYLYGNDEQKKVLKELSENYKKELDKNPTLFGQSDALQSLLLTLKSPMYVPEMYVPVEKFAVEQSSQTFGNAAFESWKKFKDSAPIITIENPPAGFALSTGEDLRNLVEQSREHFVKKAVESGKLSEADAKKQAEKLIGVTWDVGHINMMRKYGFEEKDILKETEKIAPLLKHVHLSDNFGSEHTELPMGMGNVPLKDIMDKLGKKGFEAKKIIEAAQWWQHFQAPPVQTTLELVGSPIYSDGVGPYWNQTAGLQQGYFEGMGMMLPQINYETFGAGFSQLPVELGGQRQGAQGSRMGGRGME